MSRAGAYETLDAAVFKWFLNIRSQNVPLSGAIIQDKAGIYLQKLNIKKNQGFWMVGCVDGTGEEISYLKQFWRNKFRNN